MTSIETKRTRLQRLIGLDETRGVRGDLARARQMQARGYKTGARNKPIADEIVALESALAAYQAEIKKLDLLCCGNCSGGLVLEIHQVDGDEGAASLECPACEIRVAGPFADANDVPAYLTRT